MHRRALVLAAGLLLQAGLPARAHGPLTNPSSISCRACHTRIYEEWASSSHARAFDSPVFQQEWQKRNRKKSCLKCHAPEGVFETGLGHVPVARRQWKGEGVSCISCHKDGGAMVGPHDTHDAAHPTIRDDAIRSVGMCASCHGSSCECTMGGEGQLHDYLHSPQRSRETCQSCHMPAVFASSVDLVQPVYPKRKGRSHMIEASRDPAVLRASMALDGFVEGRWYTVGLTNEASAHKLPGGPQRALVIETVFTDQNGLEFDHQVEYVMEKTRTRLRPAEARSWRYLLRPYYRALETRVLYRLFEEQPRPDWILVDRLAIRLDGGGPVAPSPELLPGHPSEGVPPYFAPPNLRTP